MGGLWLEPDFESMALAPFVAIVALTIGVVIGLLASLHTIRHSSSVGRRRLVLSPQERFAIAHGE